MIIFDSHCHLEDEKFANDLDAVLNRMEENNVKYCICAGSDMQTSQKIVNLSQTYEQIYACVGIHPHEAKHFKKDDLSLLKEWAKLDKVLGIGEIGLDYYYDLSDRQVQKDVLNRQLDLALEIDMPVMFHIRDAHGDMLDLLKKRGDIKKAVLHCFSGSLEIAKEYIKMGYIISFAGPITFKNAAKLPDVASIVPLDQFFIETDSPYLAPVPYRGKRNEPTYVVEVAKKIAEIKGISLEQVAEHSLKNVCRFYSINI